MGPRLEPLCIILIAPAALLVGVHADRGEKHFAFNSGESRSFPIQSLEIASVLHGGTFRHRMQGDARAVAQQPPNAIQPGDPALAPQAPTEVVLPEQTPDAPSGIQPPLAADPAAQEPQPLPKSQLPAAQATQQSQQPMPGAPSGIQPPPPAAPAAQDPRLLPESQPPAAQATQQSQQPMPEAPSGTQPPLPAAPAAQEPQPFPESQPPAQQPAAAAADAQELQPVPGSQPAAGPATAHLQPPAVAAATQPRPFVAAPATRPQPQAAPIAQPDLLLPDSLQPIVQDAARLLQPTAQAATQELQPAAPAAAPTEPIPALQPAPASDAQPQPALQPAPPPSMHPMPLPVRQPQATPPEAPQPQAPPVRQPQATPPETPQPQAPPVAAPHNLSVNQSAPPQPAKNQSAINRSQAHPSASERTETAPEHGTASEHSGNRSKSTANFKSEKEAEEALEKEENSSFSGALRALARAENDPRVFFMDQVPIQTFMLDLKKAISLSHSQGHCLEEGNFAGYGCLDDGKHPQICKCKGLLLRCGAPSSPDDAIQLWTSGHSKQALTEVKAYLLGQCYTPTWLPYVIGLGVLVLIFCLFKMCSGAAKTR